MSLSNLTASGWVWFALTLIADLQFLSILLLALRHRPSRDITIEAGFPALMTARLLWPVTP